ncbi:hypothetical protein AB0K68_06105 [Streptomyces sp. NPDC050698]
MTGTEVETAAPEAPGPEEEFQRLGRHLLRTAKNAPHRAAVQALVEERTILSLPAVQRALVVDTSRGQAARFKNLSGRQYGLGLDEGQRDFLGLILSMLGMGITTLASVQDLDDRRLPIILRAIVRLAGNETIAVGTRL